MTLPTGTIEKLGDTFVVELAGGVVELGIVGDDYFRFAGGCGGEAEFLGRSGRAESGSGFQEFATVTHWILSFLRKHIGG
jgi:hypothetical protein